MGPHMITCHMGVVTRFLAEGCFILPLVVPSSGAYAGLRASGKKGDLSLVVCDTDAKVGGTFTLNVMCAAPVLYCKDVLSRKKTIRAVSVEQGGRLYRVR